MLIRADNKNMPFVLDESFHHPYRQIESCQFRLSGDFASIVILSGAIARALYNGALHRDVNRHNIFVLDEGFHNPQGQTVSCQFTSSSDFACIVSLSVAIAKTLNHCASLRNVYRHTSFVLDEGHCHPPRNSTVASSQ